MTMTRGMRRLIRVGLSVFVFALIAIFLRLWWASLPPSRPSNMPLGSVYIDAPAAPFEFSPRGWWLGCWRDTGKAAIHCAATDWRGHVEFEDDYRPLSGGIVPSTNLILAPTDTGDLWMWSETLNAGVPIAHLTNGQVLVPAKAWDELRKKLAPSGNGSP
jgi:hypothetical protein